jgi:hypothetical protein
MASAFEGVPAWPGEETPPDRHHNAPPLEERIAMEFEDQLRDDRLLQRIEDLTASAGRAPDTIDESSAKQIGDLLAMARACRKEVEGRREIHNRPLLNAQRALKGRADALLQPMDAAMNALKTRLDDWMREQRRIADQRQREADEAARKARDAAEAEAAAAREAGREPPPAPVVEPARVEAPKLRSDLGSTISSRKVWRHEIEVPIKSLPKAILENEKVRDAVNQVIGAMVRSGTREIKGVRIFEDTVANIR